MKQISLVQIGIGVVGGTLVEQVLANRERWRVQYGLDVRYAAVASRMGAVVAESRDGLDADDLRRAVNRRRAGSGGGAPHGHAFAPVDEVVGGLDADHRVVVLDAAAGDQTATASALALERGGGAVLSNKAPMALPSDDPTGATLWSHAGSRGRLRYESTCGAGLPVISTLRSLIDTGDDVKEISGALSGTFGAIFSAVAGGKLFSDAVRDALAQGYTEPDPRDDLSGLDVARKGLILARTLGQRVDLADIAVHSLVPDDLRDVSVDEFLARIESTDAAIRRQVTAAVGAGTALKYLLHWEPTSAISVGLRHVPTSTVLGALQGPENIVSFRTRRYDAYPCVISGPGAGADVTAAGMVSDLLAVVALID